MTVTGLWQSFCITSCHNLLCRCSGASEYSFEQKWQILSKIAGGVGSLTSKLLHWRNQCFWSQFEVKVVLLRLLNEKRKIKIKVWAKSIDVPQQIKKFIVAES